VYSRCSIGYTLKYFVFVMRLPILLQTEWTTGRRICVMLPGVRGTILVIVLWFGALGNYVSFLLFAVADRSKNGGTSRNGPVS
jgi:hypothetical protein